MVKREKSEQKHFLQLLLIISINVGVFSPAPLNERVCSQKEEVPSLFEHFHRYRDTTESRREGAPSWAE